MISPPETRAEHPGKLLRRLLEEKGWTQDELALILGRNVKTISGIINGKSGVSPDMAVALSATFGNTADEWMRLDASYQLSLVSEDPEVVRKRARVFSLAPVREMRKRGWLKEESTDEELDAELRAFFGGSIEDGIRFPVATRRTVVLPGLNAAENAWCFRARQLARALPVKAFSPGRLDQLEKKLRHLAADIGSVHKLPAVLADYGIRFVVVEPLPGARMDGAAFWLGEASPVIAVSARWDRIDAFWFTVMHEFFHVKNGDAISADANLLSEREAGIVTVALSDDAAETRANEQAANLLVPKDEIDSFVRRLSPLYSRDRINQFANKVRMHPGVIVGQLQHRKEIGYSAHRDFLIKIRARIVETAFTDGWGRMASPGVLNGEKEDA